MTSLTTYFPPITAGDFYTPAMMKFDGSTGYYANSTFTTSGNKVAGLVRFKHPTFLTATTVVKYALDVRGPSYFRCVITLQPSDAVAEIANKAIVYVRDTSNTDLCKLLTTIDVVDGTLHTIGFSFDGDTGTASLVVDDPTVSADDTGYTDRVAPTTGTVDFGASSRFYLGTNVAPSAGRYFDGEIGFVGYADAYITNWSDFMDPQGNPKDIEDNLSTVWGGTPLFWNQYGDMENNLGSAGAMTRNGSIVVSDDGTTGSSYALSATAVASDIASGKTAWVNGQKVTGSSLAVPKNDRTLIQWDAGAGVAGAFTPAESDMYLGSGVTLEDVTGGDIFVRDGEGYCYTNSNTAIVRWALPAFTGVYREYRWTIQTIMSSWIRYNQILLRFNWQDTSNWWYVRNMGRQVSDQWGPELLSYIAATESSKSSATLSSTYFPNVGTGMTFCVRDYGDMLTCQASSYNVLNASSISYVDNWYYEYLSGTRPLKSATGLEFYCSHANSQALGSLTVEDIVVHT
jgi:hypothetical protein